MHNLFIRHLHSRSKRLQGLDHLEGEAPDRWSHGQRGAGGSCWGQALPGLAGGQWPHTPPPPDIPLRFTGKPIKSHLATQAPRPDCEECVPRCSHWTEPSSQHRPESLSSMERKGHGCTSDLSFMLKPHHLTESCSAQMPHSLHPRCLRLEAVSNFR